MRVPRPLETAGPFHINLATKLAIHHLDLCSLRDASKYMAYAHCVGCCDLILGFGQRGVQQRGVQHVCHFAFQLENLKKQFHNINNQHKWS
jgi:hypothetical protein